MSYLRDWRKAPAGLSADYLEAMAGEDGKEKARIANKVHRDNPAWRARGGGGFLEGLLALVKGKKETGRASRGKGPARDQE